MDNKTITKENLKKVKELLEKINTLSEDEYKDFLNSSARFHQYSVGNQLILWAENCSQVAGFKTWQTFKRTVKKGEKAHWILAPAGLKTFKKEVIKSDGTTETKEATIQFYRSVPVFDISQTEGEQIKYGMTLSTKTEYATIKAVAEKLGYNVTITPLEMAQGGGFISNKNIVLNGNLSTIENTGTLIHECMHGLLGHGDSKDIKSRDVREQEAETATYIICQKLGVERKSEFYLKSWNVSKDVMNSFKQINKAVKTFMENMTV